jgi:membrane protein YfhO
VQRQPFASWVGAAIVLSCVLVPTVWWHGQLPMRSGPVRGGINRDAFFYTVPALHYAAQRLTQGSIPLWDPYDLCGTPYLAAQHHGMLYPPNWLVVLVPVATALRLLLFAHAVLAMAASYWCARAFGISRSAALFAAAGYTFSGTLFNLAVAHMPAMPISAAWLPLHLGLTRAVLRAGANRLRYAIALGACVAMMVLGGHPQYVLWSTQLCGAYAAAHLLCARHRPLLEVVAGIALAGAVAFGLSAAQVLSTTELMLRSPRRPHAISGLGQDVVQSPISPGEVVRRILSPVTMFGTAGEGHLPTVVLCLLPVALVRARTRKRAAWLAALAVVSGLLTAGTQTPVYRWYLMLPGSDLFRFPDRFILITTLCMALLGGLGADVLRQGRRFHVMAALASGIGFITLLYVIGWSTPDAVVRAMWPRLPLMLLTGAWIGLFLTPRRWLGRTARHALVVLAAAASVVEAYATSEVRLSIPANHPDAVQVPAAPAAYIHARQGFARTFAAVPPFRWDREVPGALLKLGSETGLWSINDNEKLFDERYAEVLRRLGHEGWDPTMAIGLRSRAIKAVHLPLLRILGVRFVLVKNDSDIAVPFGEPVFTDAAYAVYEMPDPLPRAYIAAAVRRQTRPEQILNDVIGDPQFILNHGAIVEDPTPADLNGIGTVDIATYAPERVELRARLSKRGLVVLQDEYDPYWRATVDGQAADTLRVNYVFRGVVVDAGDHTVRFTYRPTLVYAGAAVTLATLVILLISGAIQLRRWRSAGR